MKPLVFSQRRNSRGIALVIVLSAVVLLAALVMGFMSSVMTERSSVNVASGGINSRQIAESTVNVIISQIREATSLTNATDSVTWASQPGAIRTYETGLSAAARTGPEYFFATPTGAADLVFKLYSADSLKTRALNYQNISGTGELSREATVISNWDRRNPNPEYTDLNEPILLPVSGNIVEPRYPVINPLARANLNGEIKPNGPGIVDGFDFKTSNNIDATLEMQVKNPATGTISNQKVPYLPMPVKWLYVLKDGTMWPGYYGPSAKTPAKMVIRVGPASNSIVTAANPIVGRTAFWTDDESSKINVNTASEGVFWDTPSVSTILESGTVNANLELTTKSHPYGGDPKAILDLGAVQPVRGEYQRYPGHPATTSLSPALGWLWLNSGSEPDHSYREKSDPNYVVFKESMYSISPYTPIYKTPNPATSGGKINNDGKQTTKGGSINATALDINPTTIRSTQPVPDPVRPTQHLYASPDDILFQPRTATMTGVELNPPNRTPFQQIEPTPGATNQDVKLSAEALERTRFFLTATSRAPELNLQGRPRVTIWPVNALQNLQTNYDKAFAFASSLKANSSNPLKFFFTRQDNRSATTDFSANNQLIFGYLQWCTSRRIPGFTTTQTFQSKYNASSPKNRDQILVCIYDYIRTVNLVDTSTPITGTGSVAPYTPKFGEGANSYDPTPYRSKEWSAQVMPIRITPAGGSGTLQGMGRFPCITEAALLFTRVDRLNSASPTPGVPVPGVQCILLLEMGTTMPGYPVIRETFSTVLRENRPTVIRTKKNKAQASDPDEYFDHVATFTGISNSEIANIYSIASHDMGYGRGFRPDLGWLGGFYYFQPEPSTNATIFAKRLKSGANAMSATPNVADMVQYYPYCSIYFDLPNQSTLSSPTGPVPNPDYLQFMFQAGSYNLKVYAGLTPGNSNNLVQEYTLDFPRPAGGGYQTFKFPVSVPTGSSDPLSNKSYNVAFLDYVPRGDAADTTLAITRSRLDELSRIDPITKAPSETGILDINKSDGQLTQFDVIRGIEYTGGMGNTAEQGDLRLSILNPVIPAGHFSAREASRYFNNVTDPTIAAQILNFNCHGLTYGYGTFPAALTLNRSNFDNNLGRFAGNGTIGYKTNPILPYGVKGVRRAGGMQGDFDRGLSKQFDAAAFNKPDEGSVAFDSGAGFSPAYKTPYYRGRGVEEPGESLFTPNRQLSSAVMFGSIPSEPWGGKPWQTLLFRPNHDDHPGAKTVPDHLLLDLFHMPVVEPYAISEPFSTAGKINLNSVIAPFGYATGDSPTKSYLRRDTALRGLMKSTKVMSVETDEQYSGHQEGGMLPKKMRWDIDLDRTTDAMEARIKTPTKGLFRSGSELCEVDLYQSNMPVGGSLSTFWNTNYAATGDNHRERPYAHLYPRVTTKSNVYTVHMRCQSLKIKPDSDLNTNEFDPDKDIVDGEYRGSTTIERFIDPNDPNLNSYNFSGSGQNVTVPRLDPYYRYRVVSTKQFSPR